LASRKGVAVYNGSTWSNVKNIPANVLTIQADSTGKTLYIGLKDEFGYITRDKFGAYNYIALKQLPENTGEFSQIYILGNKVFFYSTKSIFILDANDKANIKQLPAQKNVEYNGILIRKDQLYVNISNTGVCKVDGEALKPLQDGGKFRNTKILFSTPANKVNVLIGTSENKLYLFDGKKFVQFSDQTQIRDFLEENILWGGFSFSDKYFAIGTITGGCVIIDKIYGKIKYNINYMTGLPDDEIYAMAIDKQNKIWIAHEHGLSRCDLDLNIRNFSTYPGIYGNINDIMLNSGRLYVASNDGVYILSEIKDIREKEIFIKEKAKFGYKFTPKKTYITHSIAHKFIPVINLSEKCKQLFEYKNQVLAISDYGLYEVSDSLALPLIRDMYINTLCIDKDSSVLYAGSLQGVDILLTSKDSVPSPEIKAKPSKKQKEKVESKWQRKKLFPGINKAVYSIVQDNFGNLIFGTDGKAYFAKKDSFLSYSEPVEITFPEKISEPIKALKVNNEIVFVQSAGVLNYDSKQNSATYKSKGDYEKRNFRAINSNNNVWVFQDSTWVSINQGLEVANNKYWKLFPKISKVFIDNEKNAWLINGRKELLKIMAKNNMTDTFDFQLNISSLTDKMDSMYVLENPVVEYERNAIKISLSAPFWLDPSGTQYRFKVDGLPNNENWSEWSSNPVIELSFVPAGNYTITVGARNILGQLTEEKKLHFTILKPFWQKDTFYYTLGGAILILVILIFFARNKLLKRKNRILEEKVRERTLELQIEKDKTEELLLNILPKETAEELKLNNKVVPRNYDLVTVLFTDFKGFTMIAEKLTPSELVHEIDFCFREFDHIISKYRIEKIKTIGDAYMCAAGLPKEDKKNAVEAVSAALEIRQFMQEYKEKCIKENKPCFEIRIGLHTGKVVAGVVGIKKYAYDIWGDTVNIASRMESSGEPGKINISGDTYELIKKKFNCTHRGKIEAKNKGQIDMYFVDGEK
jgi:class 3 adenylate cyclase